MRKMIAVLGFALAIGLGQLWAQSPPTDPGMRLVSQTAKTKVLDIRIDGMFDPSHAARLDEHLETKESVLSAETDYERGICRVEILNSMEEALLHDCVRASGFEIAKAFDQ